MGRFADLLPQTTQNDPSRVVSMREMTPDEQAFMRSQQTKDQNRKLFQAGRDLIGRATDANSLQAAGDFELLEALNQSRLFGERRDRWAIYEELQRRQYPDEFIEKYINLDKKMGIKQSMIEEIPETAGGMIGAGVGTLLSRGNPDVATRYQVAGAGIGAAAGELGKEAFNRVFRPEQKRAARRLASDTAWTAATEALGEYGGGLVFKSLRGAPVEKELVQGAERMSGKLQRAGEALRPDDLGRLAGRTVPNVPTALTPAQATASRLMGTIEEVVDSSFIGGGRLNQVKRVAQPAALKKLVETDLDGMMTNMVRKMSPAEIGLIVDDTIKQSNAAYGRISEKLYEQVDKAVAASAKLTTVLDDAGVRMTVKEPIKVDVAQVKRAAQEMLDKLNNGKAIEGVEGVRKILTEVSSLDDKLTFGDAANVRSVLLKNVRYYERSMNENAKSLSKRLAAQFDEYMEAAAQELPEKGLQAWRRANDFYKAGRERFGGKVVRNIALKVDENPELVVKAVFGTPGDEFVSPVTRARNVKKILLGTTGKTAEEMEASRKAWDQLRYGWLQSKIAATVDEDGVLVGKKFQQALNDTGADALKEMFSPAELQNIQDWATLGRLIQQKKPGTLSTFFMRTLQPVGGAGFAASGKESMALAVLGGPAVLSRFITSDAGRKWLTTGLYAANKGAEIPAGYTGQFVAGMLRAKAEYETERADLADFIRQENDRIESMKRAEFERQSFTNQPTMGSFR